MNLRTARDVLQHGPLKFGEPEQIEAVRTVEHSGPRSDGQKRRWGAARRRFVHLLAGELELRVIPCPHCGRVPWEARPACGVPLVKAYGLWNRSTRGGAARWLLEYARAWYRVSSKRVLRMVEDVDS